MRVILSLFLSLIFLSPATADSGVDDLFVELKEVKVGRAPHGSRLHDGKLYIAMAGEDEIWVLDGETLDLLDKWPVAGVPLGLIKTDSGWLVAPFRAEGEQGYLLALDEKGKAGKHYPVPKAPSLFSPYKNGDIAYIVSEFGDGLTLFDTKAQKVIKTYTTGKQPYPADITRDGILAFVPNRGDSTVSVIDLLNGKEITKVPVCKNPEGGALTEDQTSYMVACNGSNAVAFINTASFEVTATVTEGIGDKPFSVVAGEDGRYAYINNAGEDTVSVLDTIEKRVVTQLKVTEKPIVMRLYGDRLYVATEIGNTMTLFKVPGPVEKTPVTLKNEVIMLGMAHNAAYNDQTRALIKAIKPDYVIAEIPPNRLEAALKGFAETGSLIEPRTKVFPEYRDVLFPLIKDLDFEIIGAAGWTAPMNEYRKMILANIRKDPARADQVAAMDASFKAMDRGEEFKDVVDVAYLNSRPYDALANKTYGGPYDQYFNDEIGPGGWTNINQAHYGLVERGLDAHRNEGKRILIIFGAAHTAWFREHLEKRDDITLKDVRDFLTE